MTNTPLNPLDVKRRQDEASRSLEEWIARYISPERWAAIDRMRAKGLPNSAAMAANPLLAQARRVVQGLGFTEERRLHNWLSKEGPQFQHRYVSSWLANS